MILSDMWDTASTNAPCAAAPMPMWAPLSAPIPTNPETVSSDLQMLFDLSSYGRLKKLNFIFGLLTSALASPSEDLSTSYWGQGMPFPIQPLNQGLFQTLSSGSIFHQAPAFLSPEEQSTWGATPSSTSCSSPPQTACNSGMYRESSQHSYILRHNFLSPDKAPQRALLQHCLQSHWLNSEELEPTKASRRSILLGFLAQNTPEAAFQCQFDGCGKGFSRQDRALGHIRMHLCHQPYACNSLCGNSACNERFSCRSYLQSHLTRQKEKCVRWWVPSIHIQNSSLPFAYSGGAFLRQNMRRHSRTCPGSSGHS